MSGATKSANFSTSTTPGYARSGGALQLVDVMPRQSDRAFLVGMTGSGKTTMARQLLSTRRYSVVIDYKRTINWSEYQRHDSLKTLTDSSFPKLLYRPNLFDFSNADNSERLWEWLYRRGNCTIYVDETALIANANKHPFYYGACLMQGREHGIELWSATQRPMDIPSIVASESEHVYAFRLRLPQDRKKVEDLTGISANAIGQLTKRAFLYAPQDGDVTGPLTLSFPAFPAAVQSS